MTEDIVSAPPPSGGFDWDAHKGSLLIVTPSGYEEGINTVHGVKSAVRADITVLTGPDTAEDHAEVLVFPTVLQGQLRRQIGRKVVGRLGQGAAKPGQKPPWLLDEATAEDLEKAKAYLAKRATPAVTGAAAPF